MRRTARAGGRSRLAGGVLGGAWLVDDGAHQAVLKWHEPGSTAPRNPDAPAVVDYLRKAGYPTPAWLAAGVTDSGRPYSIQEFVFGDRVRRLDRRVADLIVDLVRLQRTLSPPTTFSWTTYMRDHVFADHASHQHLTSAGGAVADLLAGCVSLAGPYEDVDLPDAEMVHCDLNVSNFILRDGRIAGVVDIDAAGRGCAVYDALTPAIAGVLWGAEPAALRRLHSFAFETYGTAPLLVAGATLVIEGLAWLLESRPDDVPVATDRYGRWLADLRRVSDADG